MDPDGWTRPYYYITGKSAKSANYLHPILLVVFHMSKDDAVRRKTISIKLSPDVWKQAKLYAVDHDLKLSQLVEIAILREIRNGAVKSQ